MPIRAECDICGAKYRLRDQMAGKRLPCKACETEFLVTSELFDEEEEDELLEDDGPRRPAGRHSSSATVPLLIAGGGLFGLLVTIGVGVLFVNYIVSKRPPSPSGPMAGFQTPKYQPPNYQPSSRAASGIPNRGASRIPDRASSGFLKTGASGIPDRGASGFPSRGAPGFPSRAGSGFPNRPTTGGPSGVPTTPQLPVTPTIPDQVSPPPSNPGRPATPPIVKLPGGGKLENDPKQPLLISGFTPAAGNPGTVLTVTGRGFQETNKVVFAGPHQSRTPTTAKFKVISDSELQITVPTGLRFSGRGNVIEVFTPKAVTVTVPRNAIVIDSPQQGNRAGAFILIRGNGSLDGGPVAGWAFVESGGVIGRGVSSRVYLQDEAVQSEIGVGMTVYHTPTARTGNVKGSRTHQFVKVSALYPSFVDKLVGDRR